jgi:ankyrin repeat protein
VLLLLLSLVLGLDPVDVLLLMAASENDLPKVEELLAAGANTSVTDSNNKTPLELATKEEVVAALQAAKK